MNEYKKIIESLDKSILKNINPMLLLLSERSGKRIVLNSSTKIFSDKKKAYKYGVDKFYKPISRVLDYVK